MLTNIDVSSQSAGKSPRYLDVAEILESEVQELAPNCLLPTEEQLAKRFGVSRVTIRGALDLLVKSGMVSRRRGRGTTVSPPKITRHFSPFFSFERDMKEQGVRFETRVLNCQPLAPVPENIQGRLQLERDSRACLLTLVRVVDDRIVCHDRRYYPPTISARLNPERMEQEDASKVLEDVVGTRIGLVDWESEIVSSSSELSAALGIKPRTLVLANTYTWLTENRVPVETGVISYRTDRCRFKYEAECVPRNIE